MSQFDLSRTIPIGEGSALAGVSRQDVITFPNGRSFKIVLYAAYVAHGLYGPENNGIAILDEDNRQVVLDQHVRIGSGYYGPSPTQLSEFQRIKDMPWEQFEHFMVSNERYRGCL